MHAMWLAGHATREIGAALGVSHNSVISRRKRDDLPGRGSPIRPNASGIPSIRQVQRERAAAGLANPPYVRTVNAPTLSFLTPERPALHPFPRVFGSAVLPIAVGAVGRARTCQWTECNRAPWRFCDAPSVAGYSWCGAHRARVFRPVEA